LILNEIKPNTSKVSKWVIPIKLGYYTNIWYFSRKVCMSKNTSVTLGNHFEQIIERSIKSGRYSSASEVIILTQLSIWKN